MNSCLNVIEVPFVSVWDGGTEVESTANVNIKTGEVTDIKVVKCSDDIILCDEQHILMNGEIVYVYEDEKGYEYWADIKGEYNN